MVETEKAIAIVRLNAVEPASAPWAGGANLGLTQRDQMLIAINADLQWGCSSCGD
jgi:hypothetical protein